MESQHLSQSNFAEKLNISAASLSSIFNDRTRPTLNHVDAIRKSFPGINLQWLLYGEGEMFLTAQNQAALSPGADTERGAGGYTETMLDFDAPTAPPVVPATQTPVRPERIETKIIDKPQRHITEIRIFYDDQTWETFLPKK